MYVTYDLSFVLGFRIEALKTYLRESSRLHYECLQGLCLLRQMQIMCAQSLPLITRGVLPFSFQDLKGGAWAKSDLFFNLDSPWSLVMVDPCLNRNRVGFHC